MMTVPRLGLTQFQIDLTYSNPFWVILISGKKMGMYYMTGTLSITWQQTLLEFLDDKLGKQ
jgi:hypothetical protein